jgi:hypothetical protein
VDDFAACVLVLILPAKAIESTSPCARSLISQIAGTSSSASAEVPSTHSIVASS